MKLIEVKHTTIELANEETKAIEIVHNLVGDIYDIMKTNKYQKAIVNIGYGDFDSLSTNELLDLSEMLSRLENVCEMR